jgi:hypothetical protein
MSEEREGLINSPEAASVAAKALYESGFFSAEWKPSKKPHGLVAKLRNPKAILSQPERESVAYAIETQEAAIADMKKVFRKVEWVDNGGLKMCPCCEAWKTEGHKPRCKLAKYSESKGEG